MLIHEKGPFVRGSILLISFLVLFCVLLTPIMRDEKGNHLTGLQYADNFPRVLPTSSPACVNM